MYRNSDCDVEDQGSKWTLGALLRRLKSQGKDVTALMMKIEDIVVKTIICAEPQISAACRMYVPYKENVFELFGFDIIIDDRMKPWVLEVNLSPSMACDAPLDLKVKSHMLCDMFNLIGVPCTDESYGKSTSSSAAPNKGGSSRNTSGMNQRPSSGIRMLRSTRVRPSSAALSSNTGSNSSNNSQLTTEERQSIRRIKDEAHRCGGFVRLFPTEDSWDLYGNFLDSHASFNGVVHQQLYGNRRNSEVKDSMLNYSMLILRQNSLHQQTTAVAAAITGLQRAASTSGVGSAAVAFNRSRRYERSLPRNGSRVRTPVKSKAASKHMSRSSSVKETVTVATAKQTTLILPVKQQEVAKVVSVSSSNREVLSAQCDNNQQKNAQQNGEKHSSISNNGGANGKQEKSDDGTATDSIPSEAPAPTPAPPPPPPQPAVPNLIADIENGHSLSVAQARSAFTRYLELVRRRLLAPMTSTSIEASDAEVQNLDLVVRFMRRAAVNLSESVKISPPSKRLALEDQRSVVANQMTEFLTVYRKDTFLLPNEDEIGGSNLMVEKEKLTKYLELVGEADLEKFLTHYTKVKKSASIFLGSPLANLPSGHRVSRSHTSLLARPSSASSSTQGVSMNGTVSSLRREQTIAQTQAWVNNKLVHPSTMSSSIAMESGGGGGGPEAEDDLSINSVVLPEAIVLHHSNEGPKGVGVNSKPPVASNRSAASTVLQQRPVSATSNGSQQRLANSANSSSLSAAVAIYSAPVRPPRKCYRNFVIHFVNPLHTHSPHVE